MNNFFILAITIVFITGYILIALEHFIKINKAATALLTGVICWTIFVFGHFTEHGADKILLENVSEIASILFFLMGAMTIVEIIDANNGFAIVTSLLGKGSKLKFLFLICLVSFFLSAVLDNLTTTIVMVTLLSKICKSRDDLLLFSGIVIIAVNAGGAWSPIGDVTTTMLWIGGQITSLSIIKKTFLACIACALIPTIIVSFILPNRLEKMESNQHNSLERKDEKLSKFIFFIGISCLLFVPVFKGITHLPPFVGMMLGLSIIWIITEIIHKKNIQTHYHSKTVVGALQRIDMPSILFFLGILLCISALQNAGILNALSTWLDKKIGNLNIIVLLIGTLSAIVDNVPLVAAGIKMYSLTNFPQDSNLWSFLAYCAGTGGSMLVIGSAAGVVAMGLAKIEFFWYLKKIAPLALIGYLSGAGVYLLQQYIIK